MASIINASTSGAGGVITTADASGELQLQSAGSTKATINNTGVDITGQLNATGNVTGASGTLYPLVLDTVKSASGTTVEFTGIPSWVKRITVMFNGVSLSGTDDILVQLGVSGNYTATYASASAAMAAGGNGFSNSTTGFIVRSAAAASITSGAMTICNLTGNVWVASHACKQSTTAVQAGGGDVALSGTLTSVRITGTSTNTFDAGTINIIYE